MMWARLGKADHAEPHVEMDASGAPVGEVFGQLSQMKANANERTMRDNSPTNGSDVPWRYDVVVSTPTTRCASPTPPVKMLIPSLSGDGTSSAPEAWSVHIFDLVQNSLPPWLWKPRFL